MPKSLEPIKSGTGAVRLNFKPSVINFDYTIRVVVDFHIFKTDGNYLSLKQIFFMGGSAAESSTAGFFSSFMRSS